MVRVEDESWKLLYFFGIYAIINNVDINRHYINSKYNRGGRAIKALHASSLIRGIRKISIFKRLLVSFLLLIIVPSIITSAVSYKEFSESMKESASAELIAYIENVSSNINVIMQKYESLSDKLYLSEELTELLVKSTAIQLTENQNETILNNYLNYKRSLESILYNATYPLDSVLSVEIVTGTDEFTQIGTSGSVKGAKLLNPRAWTQTDDYQRAVSAKGMPVWIDSSRESGVFVSQLNDKASLTSYLTLTRAIMDSERNKSIGVLVINISTKAFLGIHYEGKQVTEANLLMIGDRGLTVSLNENVKAPRIDRDVLQSILSEQTGSSVREVGGVQCLVVSSKLENTEWAVVGLTPWRSLISGIYSVGMKILIIGIVCIVFAYIVSYFVTLSISRPVKELIAAMGKVRGKTDHALVADSSDDEIGALGLKFNNMLSRINELIETIYETELNQKNEELKRKQAELDALQMQIDPHFLYNTLDIIRWEVALAENGDGNGSRMIKAFADLLRFGTKRGADLVLLDEEFNHIRAYVKVIEYKQMSNIALDWEIEDDVRQCCVTKLILQPLVENAVKHGLFNGGDMKLAEANRIGIKAYAEGEDVIIEIADNGCGISPEKLNAINTSLAGGDESSNGSRTGIGLSNVNERIKLTFGDRYGIRLRNGETGGAVSIVRIPRIAGQEERVGHV